MSRIKLLHLVIIISLLCWNELAAQQHWMRSLGGHNHDEILCSAKDGDNILMAGYFNTAVNFGPVTHVSSGNSDGFLIKTNQVGTVIWAKKFGGAGADRIYDVSVGPNGNIAISGYFSGTAQFGNIQLIANSNTQDGFVCLLDSDGDVIWAQKIGGQFGDLINSASIDGTGNVIITGHFKGNGVFGLENFNSTLDPETAIPTNDLFISKIGPGGQFMWTKHGIANKDDRGLDLAVDYSGNIYVTAQSSDTLYLDEMYPNNVFNSGILIKIAPNGDELWHKRFEAFQCLINDIQWEENTGLTLTGDYIGQMLVSNENGYEFILSDYNYNILCVRMDDENGDVIWHTRLGSDNQIASTALDFDPLGNTYLIGTFKCSFTELADSLGSGLYYSRGFRDLITIKIDPNGNHIGQWAAGGPRDDFSSAIVVFDENMPLIGGSYEYTFNTMAQSSFITGIDYPYLLYHNGVNATLYYCDEGGYGNLKSVFSAGGKDLVFGKLIDSAAPEYDIFLRADYPNCTFDFRFPCIENCADSIEGCGEVDVHVDPRTGYNWRTTPHWNVYWNGQMGDFDTTITSNQMLYCVMEREDQCYSWTDSIEVIIRPFPDGPTITDDHEVNFDSPPDADPVYSCDPVLLDGGNMQDNIYWWDDEPLYDSLLWVYNTGSYYFYVENEYGCKSVNRIYVNISSPIQLDTIDPYIELDGAVQWIGQDSIAICEHDKVRFNLMDGFTGNPVIYGFSEWWTEPYANAPDYVSNNENQEHQSPIEFYSDGWYTIFAEHLRYSPSICDSGEVPYPIVTLLIHVTIYDQPYINVLISGDNFVCPGDTVLLTASGGANYSWTGPGIISQLSEDSILVNQFGWYNLDGDTISVDGCSDLSHNDFYLQSRLHPQINMSPANGIVCPGDSVQITAQEGIAFEWIDPYGTIISNEETIYAEVPGYYYCIIELEDGCIMESNFVEVKEYSSPYLLSYPGTELCVNGAITLQVITNPEAVIQWGAPFYNSYDLQIAVWPGLYEVTSTLCGISTQMEIEITESDTPATLTLVGDSMLCPGDSALLVANSGMQMYEWVPGGVGGDQLWIFEPGTYYVMTYDEVGCIGVSDPIEIIAYPLPLPSAESMVICEGDSASMILNTDLEIDWYYHQNDSEPFSHQDTIIFEGLYNDTILWFTVADEECTSLFAAFEIFINPASQSPEILNPDKVCFGHEVHLETGSQFLSHWAGPNGQTFFNNEWHIPFANEFWNGQYTAFNYDEQCASDTLYFNLFVSPNSILEIDSDGAAPYCVGDTINYVASGPFETYYWLPDQYIGGNFSIYLPHQSNTLVIQATDFYGCISDTIIYIPAANPVPENLDDEYHNLCSGASLSLNSGGNIANWFDGDGDLFYTGFSYNTGALYNSGEIIIIPFNAFGCEALPATIQYEVYFSTYNDSILAPQILCEGEDLTISIENGDYSYTWFTPIGDTIAGNTLFFPNVNSQYSGIYQVLIENQYCSVLSIDSEITVFDTPEILVAEDSEYCSGAVMLIDAPEGLASFEWPDGSSTNIYVITETGWLFIDGYTMDGCYVSDSIYVENIECETQDFNVFSPNGDGTNDQINFHEMFYRACHVVIYNRWGNEVYNLRSTDLIWQGLNNNGDELEEGTYFYILSSEDCYLGDGTVLNGTILLKR